MPKPTHLENTVQHKVNFKINNKYVTSKYEFDEMVFFVVYQILFAMWFGYAITLVGITACGLPGANAHIMETQTTIHRNRIRVKKVTSQFGETVNCWPTYPSKNTSRDEYKRWLLFTFIWTLVGRGDVLNWLNVKEYNLKSCYFGRLQHHFLFVFQIGHNSILQLVQTFYFQMMLLRSICEISLSIPKIAIYRA